MKTEKILTIAIPTFNRLNTLKLLLNSIFEQIDNNEYLREKIEILVSDNNSNDGTTSFLNDLKNSNKINCIFNESNFGPSINIIKCFEYTKTTYLWTVGDDDLPLFNSIALIISILENENPNLFYLPAKWINHPLDNQKYKITNDKNVKLCNYIDLIILANSQITFISSWIINKELYKNILPPRNPRQYINTSLPHLEWIISLLMLDKKIMASNDNWIIARGGNSGGYNVIKVFSEEFIQILSEKSQEKISINYLIKYMLYQTIPSFLWSMRINKLGNFNKEIEFKKTKHLLSPHMQKNPLYRVHILLLLNKNNLIAFISRVTGKLYFKANLRVHAFILRKMHQINHI